MRIVIRDREIRDAKRINVIMRALTSLAFEANNGRGIMPKFWTHVTLSHEQFSATRGWRWIKIWISIPHVLYDFQWMVKCNELDKYFPF